MIETCLKEAATPLHLLGLYRPQIHRRLSHQLQMQVQWTPPLVGKGGGAVETEAAEVVRARMALIPPSPPPPAEVDRKRKMDFLAKSKSQSLVGKGAT